MGDKKPLRWDHGMDRSLSCSHLYSTSCFWHLRNWEKNTYKKSQRQSLQPQEIMGGASFIATSQSWHKTWEIPSLYPQRLIMLLIHFTWETYVHLHRIPSIFQTTWYTSPKTMPKKCQKRPRSHHVLKITHDRSPECVGKKLWEMSWYLVYQFI